jgi:hypothetical protein
VRADGGESESRALLNRRFSGGSGDSGKLTNVVSNCWLSMRFRRQFRQVKSIILQNLKEPNPFGFFWAWGSDEEVLLDGCRVRSRMVAWLTGVTPPESIALLGGLGEEYKRSTLRIIASHADPQVTRIIEDVATDAGTTDSLRSTAISLLGSEALRTAATKDRSTRVRSEAVSALARKSGASNTIVEVARKDADAGVRKRAVQALSRVRSDEAVPLLIELARDRNTEPALRKEAISGLGRVRDPKAQAYLQDLLSR